MSTSSLVILKTLINRYHLSDAEELYRFLPEVQAELLRNEKTTQQNALSFIPSVDQQVRDLHPSWLDKAISRLNDGERSLMIRALPKEARENLGSYLKMTTSGEQFSENVRRFVLAYYYQKLLGKMPPSPKGADIGDLSPLLTLSDKNIDELIHYWGLYDLAETLRQVIDKCILTKVYACLNEKKQKYLKYCFQNKDSSGATPLNLNTWRGESEALEELLKNRGLLRFSIVLSGQSPNLLWYISHKLDIEKGKYLMKHYNRSANPKLVRVLSLQLISLSKFLEPSGG
jgi:hypothetical protein